MHAVSTASPMSLLSRLQTQSPNTTADQLSIDDLAHYAALTLWEEGANIKCNSSPVPKCQNDEPNNNDKSFSASESSGATTAALAELARMVHPVLSSHREAVEATLLRWATVPSEKFPADPVHARLMPLRAALALVALRGEQAALAALIGSAVDLCVKILRGRPFDSASCTAETILDAIGAADRHRQPNVAVVVPSAGVVLPVLRSSPGAGLNFRAAATFARGFVAAQLQTVQWWSASAVLQQKLEQLQMSDEDEEKEEKEEEVHERAAEFRAGGVLEALLALALVPPVPRATVLPCSLSLDRINAAGLNQCARPSLPIALQIAKLIRGTSSVVTKEEIAAQTWRAVFGGLWARCIDAVFVDLINDRAAEKLTLFQRDLLMFGLFPFTLAQLGYEFLWARWARLVVESTRKGQARLVVVVDRVMHDLMAVLALTTFPDRLRRALPTELRRFVPFTISSSSSTRTLPVLLPAAQLRTNASTLATPIARVTEYLRSRCGVTSAEIEMVVEREIAALPEVLELALLQSTPAEETLRGAKKARLAFHVLLAGLFYSTHSPKYGRCLSLFETLTECLALTLTKLAKKAKSASASQSVWCALAVELVPHTQVTMNDEAAAEATEWAALQFLRFVIQWYIKSIPRPSPHDDNQQSDEARISSRAHLVGFLGADEVAEVFECLVFSKASPMRAATGHTPTHPITRWAVRDALRGMLFAQLAALGAWSEAGLSGAVVSQSRGWRILAMDLLAWSERVLQHLLLATQSGKKDDDDNNNNNSNNIMSEPNEQAGLLEAVLCEYVLVYQEFGLRSLVPPAPLRAVSHILQREGGTNNNAEISLPSRAQLWAFCGDHLKSKPEDEIQ